MDKKRMNTQVREKSVTITREQYDTVLHFLTEVRAQLRAKIDAEGRTDLIAVSNSAHIATYWLIGGEVPPLPKPEAAHAEDA